MSGLLIEGLRFIKGLDPVADAFAGTVTTDVVDMAEFSRIVFIRHQGVGATGTSVITVEACDDIVPTNTTAIAFHSRDIDDLDTELALTARAAAGYTPAAGSSAIMVAEVREDALAASGYRYIRAKYTEGVDSPVLGGVLILGEKKSKQATSPNSAID